MPGRAPFSAPATDSLNELNIEEEYGPRVGLNSG
jgi:hypothetical protein